MIVRPRRNIEKETIEQASHGLSRGASAKDRTCRTRLNPRELFCLRYFMLVTFLYSLSNSHAFLLLPGPEHGRRSGCQPTQKDFFAPNLSWTSLRLHQSNSQIIRDDDIPTHVGFICDGNSRWAKKRHLPTAAGHLAGAGRVVSLLDELRADGIQYCTFYGFSTENWNRSEGEIDAIFQLMEHTARTLTSRLDLSAIKIRFLGDLEDQRIPQSLKNAIEELQQKTGNAEEKAADDTSPGKLTVCCAINYGGRQDILQASQKIASAVKNGEILTPNDITEDLFASYLSTAGIPDPDMIIRTGGESRLSNFLIWNCAYSEIFVSPAVWYQQRQRRFGSRVQTPPTNPHEAAGVN
jgi:undecaprenyl diphosphate synthase